MSFNSKQKPFGCRDPKVWGHYSRNVTTGLGTLRVRKGQDAHLPLKLTDRGRRSPSTKMAPPPGLGLSTLTKNGSQSLFPWSCRPQGDALPLVKMAPARASLPGSRPRPAGFTARAWVTTPRFRRKKRRERWRRLRFEFQRRRQSPNKTWAGGGGDLGSRAGRDSEGSRWRRRHGRERHRLFCGRDGLGAGRGRHPPHAAQRLQVRPGLCRVAVNQPGFPSWGSV